MNTDFRQTTLTMPTLQGIKPKRQIILWVVANAGGIGKTTLGLHLGYRMAQLGLKVALIDLDTNGSAARFCGLESDRPPEQTSAALFDRNFSGQYPFQTPEWGHPNGSFEVCVGGDVMLSVSLDLPSRTGREFILKRAFKKYPLDHDILILDSPASLDVLSYSALAVATHILMPIPMSVKLTGIDSLLQWIRVEAESLDLDPMPELLGGIPMRVANNADQKAFYSEISAVLEEQKIPCFSGIRYSSEFENASNRGRAPLFIHRPGHAACKDFDPIVQALCDAIQSPDTNT
jgi:chromosome partitioning protein